MNQPAMRRITNIINKHGKRLRGTQLNRFLTKALDQWDGAVKDNSIPAIDTSEADRSRKNLERQQRNDSTAPAKRGGLLDSIKRKKRATGKHGRPISFTRFNVKHANGEVWSYEVKPNGALVVRPPSQFDTPTYTEEQWRTMHEGISQHIEESKQPAKEADKKEKTTMQKSTRLEKLIAAARNNPARLQPQTLQALNNHLHKIGQPVITLPPPQQRWGVMPSLSDIANNVRYAVAQTPAPRTTIPAPGGRMTTQELLEHRLQQAREAEQRRIAAAKEAPKGSVVANWLGGGVVH